MKVAALLALLIVCVVVGTHARADSALLYFDSELGDYIGQGRELTLTPEDAPFTVIRNFDNGVGFSIRDLDAMPPIFWNVDFAAPFDATLSAGAYENATRWPFQAPAEPGLSLHGDGRGCNTLTGRFDVLEAVFDPNTNEVLRFAANFEQHCEGAAPGLLGWVRYNSDVAAPRMVPGLTPVKATHFRGARDRIDALRASRGLSAAAWTDPVIAPGVTPISAAHTLELRMRLNEVYAADGLPIPFPSPIIASGTVVRAKDINNVLDAIGAVEN